MLAMFLAALTRPSSPPRYHHRPRVRDFELLRGWSRHILTSTAVAPLYGKLSDIHGGAP